MHHTEHFQIREKACDCGNADCMGQLGDLLEVLTFSDGDVSIRSTTADPMDGVLFKPDQIDQLIKILRRDSN